MKNLITVLVLAMTTVAYGQDAYTGMRGGESAEIIEVKGIGEIEVGGMYTFTAKGRELENFQEIIDKTVEVLTENGIDFSDQFGTHGDIDFTHAFESASIHYQIVRDNTVQISWIISTDNGIGVLAFLELHNTLFEFSVEARYL